MATRPLVGISVLITRRATPTSAPFVLLGLRCGSHGANTWCTPGGHLEHGESFEVCAARETEEETGLRISEHTTSAIGATNDFFPGELLEDGTRGVKHYVTVVVRGEVLEEDKEKEPKVMEPNKCKEWRWVSWDQVKRLAEVQMGKRAPLEDEKDMKLFTPIVNFVKCYPDVDP